MEAEGVVALGMGVLRVGFGVGVWHAACAFHSVGFDLIGVGEIGVGSLSSFVRAAVNLFLQMSRSLAICCARLSSGCTGEGEVGLGIGEVVGFGVVVTEVILVTGVAIAGVVGAGLVVTVAAVTGVHLQTLHVTQYTYPMYMRS